MHDGAIRHPESILVPRRLPVIELDGAGLSYTPRPGGMPARPRTAPALEGITLDLLAGEFRWLTGAPGAGKTSLIRLLALAERPSAGQVLVLGCDARRGGDGARARARRRIGVVHERPMLVAHLSAFENVALALRIAGLRPDAARIDAIEMLEWVGLGRRMHEKAGTLSRGEIQLCAIARAVATRPDLLLADEPLAGLGPRDGDRLFALFREMNRLGAAVVFATRDTARCRELDADEIRLDAGRIAARSSVVPRALTAFDPARAVPA